MAGYLVPPTKNPGDVLTSALWNQSVRDNLDFGMVRPIADTILGASAATIDFASIPQTFAHLIVVVYGRTDSATAALDGLLMRFNNDSAANYDRQELSGQAATASAVEAFATTSIQIGLLNGGASGASLFSGTSIEIPQYAGATGNKMAHARTGAKAGTSTTNMTTRDVSGYWRSSAAINRITLLPSTGNFAIGTRATLYGMGGI